jgi:hypothetical protein
MLRPCLLAALLFSTSAEAQDAQSPFGRTLHVQSTAAGGAHKGEIRAVIDQPYAIVATALARPEHWCDILTLQVNIKRCDPSSAALTAFIARKPRDKASDAHRIDFRFDAAKRADNLQVALNAASGPMGTRDYEIRLQAKPLDARRTSLHLTYAYTLGTMAKLAMDAYLVGPGREKVGFTVLERKADGSPVYVDGVRGVIERSAMRYYLAAEASLPPGQPLETRLRRWYTAISRHPQLYEKVGAEEYVEMKRREANAS